MKNKTMVVFMCFIISGCSASSLLPGLIGSKPEITAQAGDENVKQTVGLTAKQDASSKHETNFKESPVGKVDTSSQKKVSTSSIKAENITADRIEIRNNDGFSFSSTALFIFIFFVGVMSGWAIKSKAV